jgi:hypothetical protein
LVYHIFLALVKIEAVVELAETLRVKFSQVGGGVFLGMGSGLQAVAQQSVHPTCGILRGLQAFFWLRVFPAPKQNPRPPTRG